MKIKLIIQCFIILIILLFKNDSQWQFFLKFIQVKPRKKDLKININISINKIKK